MARKNNGRKKIELEKINNDNQLQVTFSKRRFGIFKKASEFSTLCGVEIGIIVFSPRGKPFSFGNPDIKSVINHFESSTHYPLQHNQDGQNASNEVLNDILTEELSKVQMEKEKKKNLDQIKKKREEMENWWERPMNKLDLGQTECLINALERLQVDVESQRFQHSQAIVPENNIVGGGNMDIFKEE